MQVKILLFSVLVLLAASCSTQAEEQAYVLLFSDQENGLSAQSVENLAAINVQLVGHMKIVGGSLPIDKIKPPIAASLFVGSDTDYTNFASELGEFEATILRGTIGPKEGLVYLEKAPMAAIVLSPNADSTLEDSLRINISHRLIKDEADAQFYAPISQILIHPVSFDDNPMEFMPGNNTSGSLGLVGAFQR